MPRVALIATGADLVGGQAIQASALVGELRKDGHDVTFLPINPRLPLGLQRLRRYPYLRTLLNALFFVPTLFRVRHADVAHVFSASYWSFLLAPVPAILAARCFGARVVLNYHSGEAGDHLTRYGILVHPWLRLVDEIVVPSECLRGVFARHGYRARVIRNVVDIARWRYRERNPVRPRLLSSRNLESHYRVDNTLQAFALVKARYEEATLTIAGSGREEGRLRRMAASLGISGIRFLGRVEPEAMPALYEESDIFVNSSVVDNQPLSVLEAFAAGLPVVSTPTGDIRGMIRSGETGLLVPPGDPGAMATAIASLLERPALSLLITRRAKREVEEHTWPRIRESWRAAYTGRRPGATPAVDDGIGGLPRRTPSAV